MLTHVQIVHVPASDQDRARDFYVDKLGLSVVADGQMGPHGRWLQIAPAGAATSLAIVPGDGDTQTGSATVVFESHDINADAQALRDRGVDLPDEVEQMPWATTIGPACSGGPDQLSASLDTCLRLLLEQHTVICCRTDYWQRVVLSERRQHELDEPPRCWRPLVPPSRSSK